MREQRANPESSRTDSITKAIKMIIRLKYTAVLAILLVASNLSAAASSRVELGTLSCSLFDVVTKTAFPEARVDCQFTPIEGEPEMLSGKIGGIGGGVEISADATMTWSVYGPAGPSEAAARGAYTPSSEHLQIDGGLRAAVLISTDDSLVELRPLRFSGITVGDEPVRVQLFKLE